MFRIEPDEKGDVPLMSLVDDVDGTLEVVTGRSTRKSKYTTGIC